MHSCKTTLLAHLLHRRHRGGTPLGQAVRPGVTAVVTEEPRSQWRGRIEQLPPGPTSASEGAVSKAGLDAARDRLLERFNAKLDKESDFLRDGNTIGREVEVEIPDNSLRGCTVLITANGKDYQLSVMGSSSAPGLKKAGRFFESFELLP